MKIEGEGKLLRIFIGESDTWHGKRSTRQSSKGSASKVWPVQRLYAASKASARTAGYTRRGSFVSPKTCPSSSR